MVDIFFLNNQSHNKNKVNIKVGPNRLIGRPLQVKVKPSYHSLPFSVLKVVVSIPFLLLSLFFYLGGLLLSLTIIGAVIGIPLIILTYALDAIALSMLLNPRLKTEIVYCPACGKKRRVIPVTMKDFTCKGCKNNIKVKTIY